MVRIMNQIALLKFLDKVVGKSFVLFLQRTARYNKPAEIKKILLIRPGGIGDAVLLLPSIKALKEKFPDSAIDILCEKRNAGIFGLSKDINAI